MEDPDGEKMVREEKTKSLQPVALVVPEVGVEGQGRARFGTAGRWTTPRVSAGR